MVEPLVLRHARRIQCLLSNGSSYTFHPICVCVLVYAQCEGARVDFSKCLILDYTAESAIAVAARRLSCSRQPRRGTRFTFRSHVLLFYKPLSLLRADSISEKQTHMAPWWSWSISATTATGMTHWRTHGTLASTSSRSALTQRPIPQRSRALCRSSTIGQTRT